MNEFLDDSESFTIPQEERFTIDEEERLHNQLSRDRARLDLEYAQQQLLRAHAKTAKQFWEAQVRFAKLGSHKQLQLSITQQVEE